MAVGSLADENADLEQKLQSNNYACGQVSVILFKKYVHALKD